MSANVKKDYIPTSESAENLGVKPATLRQSLCTYGHYLGIRPLKLPNGRLLWSRSEIDGLLEKGFR